MNQEQINKTAKAIFDCIKATLKERKEVAKSYAYADTQIEFSIDSCYNREKNKYIDSINIWGKKFGEFETNAEIREVSDQVIRLIHEQQKVRGWGNLLYTTTTITDGVSWDSRKYTIIDKIALPDNPCKEFKSLQNYLNKYGNITIPDFQLFSVRMGGKRGTLYGEEGDRRYLANKANKCELYLKQIRANKGSKDTITCKFGRENYIDPVDRKYSEYHEVECDGEGRNYVEVTITSPQGKVKYTTKIY